MGVKTKLVCKTLSKKAKKNGVQKYSAVLVNFPERKKRCRGKKMLCKGKYSFVFWRAH